MLEVGKTIRAITESYKSGLTEAVARRRAPDVEGGRITCA